MLDHFVVGVNEINKTFAYHNVRFYQSDWMKVDMAFVHYNGTIRHFACAAQSAINNTTYNPVA